MHASIIPRTCTNCTTSQIFCKSEPDLAHGGIFTSTWSLPPRPIGCSLRYSHTFIWLLPNFLYVRLLICRIDLNTSGNSFLILYFFTFFEVPIYFYIQDLCGQTTRVTPQSHVSNRFSALYLPKSAVFHPYIQNRFLLPGPNFTIWKNNL